MRSLRIPLPAPGPETEHEQNAAEALVRRHADPETHEPHAEMHAEQPAEPHRDEPGGKQRRAHGEAHVTHGDEAAHHRDVDGTAKLQREFHEDDLPGERDHRRILGEDAEDGLRKQIDKQVDAFRHRNGGDHRAPHAPAYGAKIVAPDEITHNDLRRLGDGNGVKIHGVGHHVAVDLRVDGDRAHAVDELHDGKLRELVGKGLGAAGKADGERFPQLSRREGIAERTGEEARIRALVKQDERKGEARHFADVGGNGCAGRAEARETAKPVDEERVEADVERVHEDGGKEHFLHKAVAAQDGAHEHVGALHRKAACDDARIADGFGEKRVRHADEAEQRRGEEQEHSREQHAGAKHEQRGNGAYNGDAALVPRADGLGREHGRACAEHAEHEDGDADDLVCVADCAHGVLRVAAEHGLVGIADEELKQELAKDWQGHHKYPARGEFLCFHIPFFCRKPGRQKILYHARNAHKVYRNKPNKV